MLQLHLRLINFIWQPKLYYKHPNNGWIHCMTMWIVALGLASLRFDLRIDVKWLECVIIMYAKMCVCGWQNATNVTTIGLIQVNSVVVYVYSTRAWQNLIMKWLLSSPFMELYDASFRICCMRHWHQLPLLILYLQLVWHLSCDLVASHQTQYLIFIRFLQIPSGIYVPLSKN